VNEHNCDPSNGPSNGQQESVCQPVHHDQSAPFQLQHANASGDLVLSFQSLKNDTDMGSLTLPRGVTAALGTNVLGVTHDRESFTPLRPSQLYNHLEIHIVAEFEIRTFQYNCL